MEVAEWVGRKVRRADSEEDEGLGDAVVLAVDDTAYAPSAWIKYAVAAEGWAGPREYPHYRSVDLSELRDTQTGEDGPRWGTLGHEIAAKNPGAQPSAPAPR